MIAAPQTIELRPTAEMQRHLIIRKSDAGNVCVSAYPKDRTYGRMIAFGVGKPHFNRAYDGLSFWVDHTIFDVTDAEAKEISNALGLEIPS